MIGVRISYFLYESIFELEKDPKKTYVYGAEYVICSLVYFVVGLIILRNLKRSFPIFYKKHSSLLLTMTLCLNLTILIKGLYSQLKKIVNDEWMVVVF